MKNIIVAQSGGPTAVINSSVSGLVIDSIKEGYTVYGAYYGITGILDENFICLNDVDLDEIKYMKTTPSSALGSCRYKLVVEDYDKIFSVFEKYNIDYFFYVGGNDSMDTVMQLSKVSKEKNIDVKIIGIPKTIDNDLVGIDHCPGFGSAAKYINTSIMELNRDAIVYKKNIVTIVEVMGRNAGWLAASTGISINYGGVPDLIYLPEVTFSFEKFHEDVESVIKTKGKVMIVVSEGIKFADGKYVGEMERTNNDKFGHAQLGGVANILKEYVTNNIEKRVKAVEFNTLQRSAMHCGSLIDIEEAFELGRKGLQYALEGHTGVMATIKRISSLPYEIKYDYIDVSLVANNEKKLPQEYINSTGNGITREGFEYFLPLIQGDYYVPKVDGLPRYTKIHPNYKVK